MTEKAAGAGGGAKRSCCNSSMGTRENPHGEGQTEGGGRGWHSGGAKRSCCNSSMGTRENPHGECRHEDHRKGKGSVGRDWSSPRGRDHRAPETQEGRSMGEVGAWKANRSVERRRRPRPNVEQPDRGGKRATR